MFKEYYIIFLLAHVLGDFYFQTLSMANKKERSIKWILLHGISYMFAMLLVTAICSNKLILILMAILASALHLIIDLLKDQYKKKKIKIAKWNTITERNIFFVDQCLHLLCLGILSYSLTYYGIHLEQRKIINIIANVIDINMKSLTTWATSLLLAHKPANIVIRKALTVYKADNGEEEKQNNNTNATGRLIGTIERIIMLILLFIGQYSAIGLVLTAKSIARFDKISNDKNFAEYYLLGTLLSLLLVILIYFMLLM